jgi:hypothetical protein
MKFKLTDINIDRVDLVDRGAAQDAHIVFAKRSDLAERIRKNAMTGYAGGKPGGTGGAPAKPNPAAPKAAAPQAQNPLARPKGAGSRIIRIAPTDFVVVEANGNMMEWAIPPEKLPEGVEEALVTMVQSGETVAFQWMIDPLAGPPVEGTASTAAEAFVAMRGALTQTSAMDPTQMLGGFPTQMPMGAPGAPPGAAPPKPGAGQLKPGPGITFPTLDSKKPKGGGAPKGRPVSPNLKKHGGPGPHQNGSDQTVHGGGKGAKPNDTKLDRAWERSMEADNKVTRILDRMYARLMEGSNPKDEGIYIDEKIQPGQWASGGRGPYEPRGPVRNSRDPRSDKATEERNRRRGLPWAPYPGMSDFGMGKRDEVVKRNAKIRRALKALHAARKRNKSRMAQGLKPIVQGKEVSRSSLGKRSIEQTVETILNVVTKGLVEVDIFREDVTGDDLRDILPPDLLEELRKLSATQSAE